MVFCSYFSWAPGEHSHGKDLGCLGGTFPVGNLDTYPALKFLVPQRSFPSRITSSPEPFRLGELLASDHVSDSTDKWETNEPPCWNMEGDNRRERPDAGTCCKENYWSSQLTRFGCFPGCESPPRFFGCSAGNGNGGLNGAHPPQVLVVSPSMGRMAGGTAASCLGSPAGGSLLESESGEPSEPWLPLAGFPRACEPVGCGAARSFTSVAQKPEPRCLSWGWWFLQRLLFFL